MLFIRLVASPTLAPAASDALRRRLADGELLACVSDPDVNATFVSVKTSDDDLKATVATIAETIGSTQAVGRAFRFELQHPDAKKISDELLRSVAVELQGAFRASVYLARRTVPAGRWATMRPMFWAADGLALGESAPALPFGGSESSGVSIEVGTPTVIAKARLVGGLTQSQMKSIAAATGGADPETIEQARSNAPLAVKALDRLISVQDYADFARTYAGIAKATAVSEGGLVKVVVSGIDDIPIDRIGEFERQLQRFMEETHSDLEKDIAETQQISDETDKALRSGIEDFKKGFVG